MTIKELFKKVDALNQLKKAFNRDTQTVYIDLGYGDANDYTTYKEFVKHFKKEWKPNYVETVLKSEIRIDDNIGYIESSDNKIIISIW